MVGPKLPVVNQTLLQRDGDLSTPRPLRVIVQYMNALVKAYDVFLSVSILAWDMGRLTALDSLEEIRIRMDLAGDDAALAVWLWSRAMLTKVLATPII